MITKKIWYKTGYYGCKTERLEGIFLFGFIPLFIKKEQIR